MTHGHWGIFVAIALLGGTFTLIPVAFAAAPGVPFDDLQNQVNELQATVAQLEQDLEDKDAELEAAIAALQAKDQQLMDKDAELSDDVDTLCTNTPIFKGTVQTVGGATVSLLNALNNNIITPVNSVITPVKNFNTGFFLDLPDPHINLPSPLPDFDVPIPGFNVPGISPFSFLATIPLIPSNTINTIDDTINTVQNCA